VKLEGLENTKHPRANVVARIACDHGPLALMNQQNFCAGMGMKRFGKPVIRTYAPICKI
jgi:hypothetical protein